MLWTWISKNSVPRIRKRAHRDVHYTPLHHSIDVLADTVLVPQRRVSPRKLRAKVSPRTLSPMWINADADPSVAWASLKGRGARKRKDEVSTDEPAVKRIKVAGMFAILTLLNLRPESYTSEHCPLGVKSGSQGTTSIATGPKHKQYNAPDIDPNALESDVDTPIVSSFKTVTPSKAKLGSSTQGKSRNQGVREITIDTHQADAQHCSARPRTPKEVQVAQPSSSRRGRTSLKATKMTGM